MKGGGRLNLASAGSGDAARVTQPRRASHNTPPLTQPWLHQRRALPGSLGVPAAWAVPAHLLRHGAPVYTDQPARLTVFARQRLAQRRLEQGLRLEEAAHAASVSTGSADLRRTRYRQARLAGVHHRAAYPHSAPHAMADLRQQQRCTPRALRQTCRHLAPPAPLGRVHRAQGSVLSRLSCIACLQRTESEPLASLDPTPPVQPDTQESTAELLPQHIKKGHFHRSNHPVTGERQHGSAGQDGMRWAQGAVEPPPG